MEIVNSVLALMASIFAVATTIAVAFTLRWWVAQQSIKALRDEIDYYNRRLEHKDRELGELRNRVNDSDQRVKTLDARFDQLKATDREKNAVIYEQDRHIRRLEQLCVERGMEIPSRDQEP